jgi:arylsulfatase A-like enzyme
MFGLVNRGFSLEHPERHLAQILRANGYYTAQLGLQHVVKDPETAGYDHIHGQGGAAAKVTPAAVEFIDTGPRQPFFMDIGFTETHRVFHPADGAQHPAEDPRYCLPPAPLPDTPETRRDMADFKASARILDQSVGAVLDALERNGLTENTLVISTTDHGIAFPSMKCNLTEHGIGVLLIMRGPGGFNGGKVVDAMVSQIDLFPTVCEVAGIAPPAWLQGTSLVPLVNGDVERVHDAVYAEVNYHAAYEPQRVVRTERWSYVRRWAEYDHPVLANCDDGYSKRVWMEHGWAQRPVAAEQLYDLIFDPTERCNLAGDPAHAETLAEMRSRLDRWMQETDDPLLRGHVPLPEGARVNPPEDTSPGAGRPTATRGQA